MATQFTIFPPRSLRALVARTAGVFTLVAGLNGSALAHGSSLRVPTSLRGSKASIAKMHEFARAHRYEFFATADDVDSAVADGKLVALAGSIHYEVSAAVGFAYATPEARAFLERLAPRYVERCASPLVVTSATRPESRQPRNASEHSVHPTGIAIDLRRPPPGPCLTWLRDTLLTLEQSGRIEVTEERRPPHLHIAVLDEPGSAPLPGLIDFLANTDSVALAFSQPGAVPSLEKQSTPVLAYEPLFRAPLLPSELMLAITGEELVPATEQVMVVAESGGDVALPARDSADGNPPAPKEVTARRARTHVVRSGDTLWDIAKRYGLSVGELQRANNLGKRSRIKPKMTLRIPD